MSFRSDRIISESLKFHKRFLIVTGPGGPYEPPPMYATGNYGPPPMQQRSGLGTGAAVGLGVGALAAGGLAGYALGGGFSSNDSPTEQVQVASFDSGDIGGDDWIE